MDKNLQCVKYYFFLEKQYFLGAIQTVAMKKFFKKVKSFVVVGSIALTFGEGLGVVKRNATI
jgi:hypothetical protein